MPTWLLMAFMGVIATTVLAGTQGLYWAWVAKKERELEELHRRLGAGGMTEEEYQASVIREEQQDAVASALGGLGATMTDKIRSADADISVSQLVIRMMVGAAIGMVVGGIAVGVPGLILGIITGIIPYALLSMQASARTALLVQQLPEALDLIARAMSAGLGMNDAFRLAAEEMPMPLAGEFGRINEEVRFGRDYRDAFGKLLERNPGVFDLRIMVSSILLQRETGGNLIEILESISGTIRSRFLFDAKVRAMTSEARMSAIILACLPFMVLTALILSNPDYLTPLATTTPGNLIIAFGFTMYTIGGFLMYDLSQVEV